MVMTHLQNTIEFKETDQIIVSLLHYNKLRKFTIGLTTLVNHPNRYTFLLDGKEFFANACKYRNINDSLSYIYSNHQEQIRKGFKPYLSINGLVVDTYINISSF